MSKTKWELIFVEGEQCPCGECQKTSDIIKITDSNNNLIIFAYANDLDIKDAEMIVKCVNEHEEVIALKENLSMAINLIKSVINDVPKKEWIQDAENFIERVNGVKE